MDQECSVFLSSFLLLSVLLCQLLVEVLPQVGQLVNLRLVRVAILFQLEESFEEQEVVLLLLQGLFHSF